MTKNIINIGLPSKGRLKHDTINIFKKNKLNIYSERGERDLFGYIKKLPNIKIIYLHARECIEQLSLGNIDVGFSGYDLLRESEINIIVGKGFFPLSKNNNKNLKIEFSAANGREVEFYSSMIFSIEVKIKSKFKNFISGGRYDQLTTNLGFKKVSAVGAAVNMNLYD